MGFSEVEPEKRQAVLAASCALLEKTAGLSSLATQAGYQAGISDDVFLRWDHELSMWNSY